MRFKLDSSSGFYPKDSPDVTRLKALGFAFDEDESPILPDHIYRLPGDYTVDIASLEELMAFVREHGRIVLFEDTIEIYDGFRE